MKKIIVLFPLLALLAGCADLNTNAFRTEKLLADTATASVAGYNLYWTNAVAGASPEKVQSLTKEREQIWDASRKTAAVLAVTEASRLAFATNSTPAAKALLQQNLATLAANSGNVTSTVASAMSPQPQYAPLPLK